MGGCTAVNCSNTRSKGFRLFRFPRDPKRRKTWLQNCHRAKWLPTNFSELCEIHFEEEQFEQHRLDGVKKLKPNAIPTLFDVPNPPRLLETGKKSLYETKGNCTNYKPKKNVSLTEKRLLQTIKELEKSKTEIKRIQDENDRMKIEIQQIKKIEEEKKLGQLNVEHLKTEVQKKTKYSLPAYSALIRRLHQFKLNFVVFTDLLDPLKHKVSSMKEIDTFCCMSVDKMEISSYVMDSNTYLIDFLMHFKQKLLTIY